jgi:hypothetical protein
MRRPLTSLTPLLLASALQAATTTRADALFAGEVPAIELRIPDAGIKKLAQDPRAFVEFTLQETGQKALEHCSIKLKGSMGSFRQINDARPGFSIRTAKSTDQTFRGLTKFQLNNSAQDGTMIHEQLAGEIARAAGVPASRCTHAYVTMNGKVLGVYVLKEGFDAEFLRPFFADTRGHLYDGGLHTDIHPGLELDKGDPKDKARITEFSQALREGDHAKRRSRLEGVLDVDAYLRHLAIENILVHGDGYSYRANNYRTYEDPATGKFTFILHGMDNVFGVDSWGQSSPRAYVFASPVVAPLYPGASVTAVSQALWGDKQDTALRERFRRQARAVYDQAIKGRDWSKRAEEITANLKARLLPLDAQEAGRAERRGLEGAAQVRRRLEIVRTQFEDAAKLDVPGGTVGLGPYLWSLNAEQATARETRADSRDCLHLAKTAPGGRADVRLPLALAPGRYRLSAAVRTRGVAGGYGFRLRLGGEGGRTDLPTLSGDRDWREVAYEFAVNEGDPTVVLELRADAGEAWIDRTSLRLTRLP